MIVSFKIKEHKRDKQEYPNPQIKDLIMYFFCGPQTPPTPYF